MAEEKRTRPDELAEGKRPRSELFPQAPTPYDVKLHELAEHNARQQEQLRELHAVILEALEPHYWRLVVAQCRIVDQAVLDRWTTAPLVWDGMPPEFEGARRHGGNGPFHFNIVLERQMTRPEAVQLRKDVVAHFNEVVGVELSWKLCEMDQATFEAGWTFLP